MGEIVLSKNVVKFLPNPELDLSPWKELVRMILYSFFPILQKNNKSLSNSASRFHYDSPKNPHATFPKCLPSGANQS